MPLNSIAGNSSDEKFLTKMNEIIEQNFSNPELSVDYLAEQLCISRSGLFAKIKSLANITPNELIQLVRLKKAAVLLTENQYRISEISYMVGFNNPSYFAKCFQKQFGMKPGEFLEKSNQQRISCLIECSQMVEMKRLPSSRREPLMHSLKNYEKQTLFCC